MNTREVMKARAQRYSKIFYMGHIITINSYRYLKFVRFMKWAKKKGY